LDADQLRSAAGKRYCTEDRCQVPTLSNRYHSQSLVAGLLRLASPVQVVGTTRSKFAFPWQRVANGDVRLAQLHYHH